VLLVLLRSGLGRVIALLGMLGLTAVLGAMAVRPAPVDDPSRNWVFLIIMLVLTGLLAAAMVRRPLPITRAELRLAMVVPLLVGGALLVVGLAAGEPSAGEPGGSGADLFAAGRLVALGALGIALGLGIAAAAWTAGRAGRGPWAIGRAPASADLSVNPWLHPARWGGLGWVATLAVLTLLPLGVYVVSYAPWIELGNTWGLPFVGRLPFMPEGAAGGQTLPELIASMYQYHDSLRASHAASSPWWAWPLDLKPVWFFSERYAGGNSGLIYDTGNVLIFWLGIAGIAFAAVTAWRRRSLSLAVVVILWAALWLPWSRIDRATFQYHVYASLPFMVLALAYFLAELWHGPSLRTWFLARAATATAILAVPLLWLLRTPLCILAGTAEAHAGGAACASEVTRTAQMSQGGLAVIVVLALGIAGVVTTAWLGARRSARQPWHRAHAGAAAWPVVIALLTLGGVVAALALLDTTTTTTLTLTSDALAVIGLLVLALPATLVMRSRDPRRLVLGLLGAAALWLVLFYPNLSGLPMPADLGALYQGLLPTWNWDFQFAVNSDPAVGGSTIGPDTLVIGIAAVLVVLGSAIAARRWVGGPPDDPPPGGLPRDDGAHGGPARGDPPPGGPMPPAPPPGWTGLAYPPGGGSGPP
jgi:hypothetical protein